MELIFTDPFYDTGDWEEGKFLGQLKTVIAETSKDASVEAADIGRGADWPVVIVDLFTSVDWSALLNVAGAFYFGVPKTVKAWQDWVGYGRKLQDLLKKQKPIRIDESAAALIALTQFSKVYKNFKGLNLFVLPIDSSKMPSEKQDKLFNITITTGEVVWIAAVRSNGSIAYEHAFKRT